MRSKQKTALFLSLGLPLLAAGAAVLMTETPVKADGDCVYASQHYSEGACLKSVCTPPAAQQCAFNAGMYYWTDCQSCTPPL